MTGQPRYDAAVIGGGHNGLVAAAYLAKAGRRVVLLEAGERLGGLAGEREIAPGIAAPVGAHVLHLLSPRIVRDLALVRHGLRYAASDLATVSLLDEGERLVLSDDRCETGASLRRLSPRDVERLPLFRARLARLAGALRPFLLKTPPRLRLDSWPDRLALANLAWSIRRLGRADMRDLLRIVAMNVADLAEEVFETHALQGIFGFDAVLGNLMGPRSPNTVFTLLYRWAGEVEGRRGALALPAGGMGGVIAALERAARAAGAEIRTEARVERLLVENDRVVGAVLDGGEEIAARNVLSSAHPRSTYLDLLGAEHLDADFVRNLRHLRGNGAAAKVNLVLDGAPDLGVDPTRLGACRFLLAPSLDYLESAHDAAKYGGLPDAPALEAVFPAAASADGRRLLSVVAQYTPHRLRGSDWSDERPRFVERVVALLDRAAPGLAGRVVASDVTTPADYERRFGLPGGHWHHAELGLDQAYLLRPVPGFAQYRAPIAGLYLCGAGAHPGGGVVGAAGANAARETLADLRRRSGAEA